MKKTVFILAILLLLISLSSCRSGAGMSDSPILSPGTISSSLPPDTTLEPSFTPAGTEASTPVSALDTLRQAAADRICAIAYLGYVEENSVDAIKRYVNESGCTMSFPFLAEVSAEQTVIAGGCDLYCVVPIEPSAQLTVIPIDYDMEGKETAGPAIYEGDGEPILLVCNVSDIMPNSQVSIRSGTEAVSFSPFISLRDGSLATTAPDGTIYDFTPLLWPLDPDACAYFDLFEADPALEVLLGLAGSETKGFTDDQISAYALTVLAIQGAYDCETGLSKEDMNAVALKHFGRDIHNFENSMTTLLENGRVTATGWSFDGSVFLVLDGQPQEQDGVITALFKCYALSDSVWLDQEIPQSKLDHIREYLLAGYDEDFPASQRVELVFERHIDDTSQTPYVLYHFMTKR